MAITRVLVALCVVALLLVDASNAQALSDAESAALTDLCGILKLRNKNSAKTSPVWPNCADAVNACDQGDPWRFVTCDATSGAPIITKLEFIITERDTELLGSLPPSIGNFTNLKVLATGASNIRFSGSIPSTVGALSNLGDLRLLSPDLTGTIPPQIGRLSQLDNLELTGKLAGVLPRELGKLSNLESLSISGSNIAGAIPEEILEINTLKYLRLHDNKLYGSLSTTLGQMINLVELNLRRNAIVGTIPVELGRLKNLRSLYLDSNELAGPLPSEIGKLSQLEILNVEWNYLSGAIPMELGKLSMLSSLSLRENLFTGAIPDAIWSLNQLSSLVLSPNKISGTIPAKIGNFAFLTQFELVDALISGTIPPEIGNLASLTALSISSTNISGPIPKELGQLGSLAYLELYNNDLTGSIPEELGQLVSLNTLDLSSNQLSGTVPQSLTGLPNLRQLNVSDNDFVCGSFLNQKSDLVCDLSATGACNKEGGKCGGASCGPKGEAEAYFRCDYYPYSKVRLRVYFMIAALIVGFFSIFVVIAFRWRHAQYALHGRFENLEAYCNIALKSVDYRRLVFLILFFLTFIAAIIMTVLDTAPPKHGVEPSSYQQLDMTAKDIIFIVLAALYLGSSLVVQFTLASDERAMEREATKGENHNDNADEAALLDQ